VSRRRQKKNWILGRSILLFWLISLCSLVISPFKWAPAVISRKDEKGLLIVLAAVVVVVVVRVGRNERSVVRPLRGEK